MLERPVTVESKVACDDNHVKSRSRAALFGGKRYRTRHFAALLFGFAAVSLFAFIVTFTARQEGATQITGELDVTATAEELVVQRNTSSIKEAVCDAAGPLCPTIKSIYYKIHRLGTLRHWLPFLLAFGAAYLVFLLAGISRGRLSLASGLGFIFPRRIFLHRSAILDYKFYLSRLVIGPFVSMFTLLFSAALVTTWVTGGMTYLFGKPMLFDGGAVAGLLYTLGLVLVVDFGYYTAHYLSHKVPILWEFHKVHHACEVLTPVSIRRMHPVDLITGFAVFGLTAGIFSALYSWAGPGEPDPITIPGTVAVLLLFRVTNVYKHSHIWVSYGRIISHLISTPAQHQIHHSIEERHLDRNFGRAFAIWDWMFGTLYLADRREKFEMGLLDEEHLDYQSVSACYLVPFVKVARIIGLSKE